MRFLKSPLTLILFASSVLITITLLTRVGITQSTKKEKDVSARELSQAVRKSGLRGAAQLKKDYVVSERSSGWAKYNLEDLSKHSSTIIVGTPVFSSSQLSPSGEMIFTEHQVRVEQTLKGKVQPSGVVRLTVLGGKVTFEDGSSAEIKTPDQGPIEVGKTYIFFMHEKDSLLPNSLSLTGGGQGLFELRQDSTIEPRGDKIDTVQVYKKQSAVTFTEEIKAIVKKHPGTSPCCQ
jgi:hypothetical protein